MVRFFLVVILLVTSGVVNSQGNENLRSSMVSFARGFLGVPYVYGAASPGGFDCTGLIWYTYKEVAGVAIPRSTRHLAAFGRLIPLEEALPGDVLIFDTFGGPSHAGIYLGEGRMVHAASAGSKTGVILSGLAEDYYAKRFLYARRILPDNAQTVSKPPVPELKPELEVPLTTFTVELTPRATRNYDRLPFLAGTMAEFEIRNRRDASQSLKILLVRGDWESGDSVPLWEERKYLLPGESYTTGRVLLKEAQSWALVVSTPEGEERAVRIFRSVTQESGK